MSESGKAFALACAAGWSTPEACRRYHEQRLRYVLEGGASSAKMIEESVNALLNLKRGDDMSESVVWREALVDDLRELLVDDLRKLLKVEDQ